MRIVMAAAENGAFAGGKVGGVGDVIREAPLALAELGHQVTVVMPGYQAFSRLPEAKEINSVTVEFAGALETVTLHTVEFRKQHPNLQYIVLEHPLFGACGSGSIYCHDVWEPFATDATKFALFCQSFCYCLLTGAIEKADVLHLHDWHMALILLLLQQVPAYKPLRDIKTVFSIHNLSIQGVRPFAGNPSSLQSWFPGLQFNPGKIEDRSALDCINLMRTAINLSDRVHVVSPSYAREILQPSHAELGFIGGEGLEKDLLQADRKKRLFGILNGCNYPQKTVRTAGKKQFIQAAFKALDTWVSDHRQINSAHYHALKKLTQLNKSRQAPSCIVTSIGRLTSQKVSLLLSKTDEQHSVLDRLLLRLEGGLFICLGSGDPQYENFMSDMMRKHDNFIFLQGYSEPLAEVLYSYCDLFLMPSSFEPCGISQMLAMRAGKPCLVHAVGGLADTVIHQVNGFSFKGKTIQAQCRNLLKVFDEALSMHENRPAAWQKISASAAKARFSWKESLRAYVEKLYA